MDDPAQALYKKKSKNMDLNRDVDGFAMWSFGLTAGQIFLLGLWFLAPLFLVASIVAIVLGFVSVSRISNKPKQLKGKGFAIAGIVIGFLQVFTYLLGIILLLTSWSFV